MNVFVPMEITKRKSSSDALHLGRFILEYCTSTMLFLFVVFAVFGRFGQRAFTYNYLYLCIICAYIGI